MLARATPVPEPAGRAVVKLPPAYTRFPTMACDQTTPLICTVGSASALTVVGVPGSLGFWGAESAVAVGLSAIAPNPDNMSASAASGATTRRRPQRIRR